MGVAGLGTRPLRPSTDWLEIVTQGRCRCKSGRPSEWPDGHPPGSAGVPPASLSCQRPLLYEPLADQT